MWRWLAAGLLLAGAAGAADPGASALFATVLPPAVGDVSRWQVVEGRFETPGERGSFAFYVNPERSALYQLMRYRVEFLTPSPEERARAATERVVFIPRPGVREPMLCWERVEGDEPSWRVVAAGTAPYVLEMTVLIRVLAAQRGGRAAP